MTDVAPTQKRPPERNDFEDPIDLRELVHVLWRRKVPVIALGLGGALLGLVLATLGTKYLSEGLLLMPSIKLEQYKRYEVALGNEPRLLEFLEQSGQRDSAAGKLLVRVMATPGKFSEAMQPAFTLTERDARVLGIKIESLGSFLGAKLSLTQPERTREQPLRLLAEYARDTAIKLDLEDQVLDHCLEYQTRELELRNVQLEDEFLGRQQKEKVQHLRRIVDSIPGAAEIDNRQVVSLEKGSERFLSPIAQIVAAEVWIADYELAQIARNREIVAAKMKKQYYCGVRDLLAKPATGRALLEQVKEVQAAVLAQQDPTIDIVEHTANAFDVEREKWNSTYLDQMRFVVAPEGAEVRVRKPGRTVGTLAGGMLGTLLGVVFALMHAWWRKNRESIVAADD